MNAIAFRFSNHCTFIIDVTANDTAAEGTVRLVGGASPLEGRVEVFLFGQWGTVCSSSWEFIDAKVVCLELGYLRAVKVPASVSAIYGTGSGPSWYNIIRCTGTETNLTECSKSISLSGSACSDTQNAGAVCSSESNEIILLSLYCLACPSWLGMIIVYSVLLFDLMSFCITLMCWQMIC